MKLRCASWC